MSRIIILALLICLGQLRAQELYVFTDPASNIPARSINAKFKAHGVGADQIFGRATYRMMPQLTTGLTKKLQIRLSASASNMHTSSLQAESVGLGVKYRILSNDGVHKHFRIAAYADGILSRVPFHYEEIGMMGDKTGLEAGLIATQLWHKFALSGSVSRTEVLDGSRYDGQSYFPSRQYQSLNYSVSGGYLLLPRAYTDYKQPNLNIYLEMLGQRLTGTDFYFLDLAPAVQLILKSRTKLNIGKRFQLQGNLQRMAKASWLISVETSFLQAWK
ncbi:MAG: hypothetical protein ACKO6Q_01465 [Bacteroidota bacterium]